MSLFPFQKTVVDQVMAQPKSFLALEMGLGKTLVAIETAKRRKARRILVCCPAIGRLVWVRELKRWWPEAPVHVIRNYGDIHLLRKTGVFIIAYSTFSGSNTSGFDIVDILKNTEPFDMTVLDESHALKNPGAIRSKSLLKTLKSRLGWVLPMSGTPAPNHAGELHGLLHAFFPEAITLNGNNTPMRQHEFENRYCEIRTRWFNGHAVDTIEGSKNLGELKQRLSPFFIRRRKKDVLTDLPDITFDTYPVTATAGMVPLLSAYDDIVKPGMSDDDVLAALQAGISHIARVRAALGLAKVAGTVEAVEDMLNSSHRKALIFAWHQSVIDALMDNLGAYAPVKIDGRDSPVTRDKAIGRFLTDSKCRVFIGNIGAAGTSITLVGPQCDVSDVFFAEASYVPGDNVQAAARIHRIGQKSAVQVWFMTAFGTVDDQIMQTIARKSKDLAALFDQ